MGKISSLTLQEAKEKGYTLKEWERAKKISKSLKIYWSSQPRKTKKVFREKKQRIRRQLVQNYKTNSPPYFASIRAITINPEITEQGLKLAILKAKRLAESDLDINFNNLNSDYIATETAVLGDNEDLSLNDYKIHAEIFIAYLLSGQRNLEKIYIF